MPTSGAFALRTTSDDRVQVATARANKLLTYSCDGKLLTGQYGRNENDFESYASEMETRSKYSARRGLLPRIVNRDTGQTVIATRWPKRLVAAPFPAVAYAATGLLFLGAAEWRRRRKASPGPAV